MGDQIDDSTNGSSFMGLGYSGNYNNAAYPQYSTIGTGTRTRTSRSSAPSSYGMKQRNGNGNRGDPSFVAAHDPDSYYGAPPLSFSPPFQEFQQINWNSQSNSNSNSNSTQQGHRQQQQQGQQQQQQHDQQQQGQQQQQQQQDFRSDRRDRPNDDYDRPNDDYEYQQSRSQWQDTRSNRDNRHYEGSGERERERERSQQKNNNNNSSWQTNNPPASDDRHYEGDDRHYEGSQQQNNNTWYGNNNSNNNNNSSSWQTTNNNPPGASDGQQRFEGCSSSRGRSRDQDRDRREWSHSWPNRSPSSPRDHEDSYNNNDDRSWRSSRSHHRSRWGRVEQQQQQQRRGAPSTSNSTSTTTMPFDNEDPKINQKTTAAYGKAINRRFRVLPPVPPPPPPQLANVPRRPKVDIEELGKDARLGRNRAREIIHILHEQKESDLDKLSRETIVLKRKECLDKLKDREHIALLKNLEYVARVEDERLQERLARVQEAQEYHYQLEDYHNQVLELRNKNAMDTLAGIGTDKRERAEKKRKQHTQHVSNDSLSIYVSNLPTDGSASDELMQALFGSYGSLRKIHLYRDKQTGDLKGDALVIYNLGEDGDRSTLTEAVCSQMNGAELPCGTPIKVEPSDPLYQLRKKKQMNYYGSASQQQEQENDVVESEKKVEEKKGEEEPCQGNITPSSGVPTGEDGSPERGNSVEKAESQAVGDADDNDDLDDFFDSLE